MKFTVAKLATGTVLTLKVGTYEYTATYTVAGTLTFTRKY